MQNICSVSGCKSPCEGHGYCIKHYKRWRKYGDPFYTSVVRGDFSKKYPAEFRAHKGMLSRCYNKNRDDYPSYGGRGITVCEEWRGTFGMLNFLKDMGPKPGPEYSIDRIDNNGNYTPDNCRWATAKEQANNRRRRSSEILFSIDGETMNFKEAAAMFGVKYQTAYTRYRDGAPINKVFGTEADIIKI